MSTDGVYSVSGIIGLPEAGAFPSSLIFSNHEKTCVMKRLVDGIRVRA